MIRELCWVGILSASLLEAQSVTDDQFEVSSIGVAKPSQGVVASGITTMNGRMTASNVTVKRCIMGAYGVGPNQIIGGPKWLDSERFEIAAKASTRVGDSALMKMLQRLLADRFKLALHQETRDLRAYLLEIGKNGPKLEASNSKNSSTSMSRGRMRATNMTMDRLAQVLSRQMDFPVVNHTGLNGAFDFQLECGLVPETETNG